MQKTLYLAFLFIFVACNSEADKTAEEELVPEEESVVISPELINWEITYDSLSGDAQIRQKANALLPDTVSAQSLVDAVNFQWPDVQMTYQKTSGDTLFVSIPQSAYLTQQMGSTGAVGYLGLSTYVLTDIKGIRFVKFDFAEGDHAAPGTYSRESFKGILQN